MIELKGVSKRYSRSGEGGQALLGVDLEIGRGELVAVTGPSACGKTTLLNIVGLIDTPSSGHYRFNGADLANRSEAELTELRRRHIGFVFQSFRLLDDLTVFENIELPLRYQRLSRRRRCTVVRELLELADLETRGEAYPDELSHGEQQRVAVVRAVANDPAMILADEPTANLDEESAGRIVEMLQTLHLAGATVLIATHSSLWAACAERIVMLHGGRIVA